MLSFALGKGTQLHPTESDPLIIVMLMVVTVLGWLTFVRLIFRNVGSDRYKVGLNRIRRSFLSGPDDVRKTSLAFDPFTRPHRVPPSWRSIGRGGWLETVAAVESLLAGVLIAVAIPTPSWWTDAGVALVGAALTWILMLFYARQIFIDEEQRQAST